MKKKAIVLLFLAALLLLCVPNMALAKNNVSSIDIEVVLYDDGSAYITQVWNGSFEEGTENYIVIDNLDGMEISDFSVRDAQGEYAYQAKWNVDASFDAKKRKCGIVKTGQGYELCFGISEYGENRYAIEYKISGLVGSYSDYDGFNFMFINPGMSTFPTDGKVKILLQNGTKLDAGNAGIWGFGYGGQIAFQDGSVVAYTQSPLKGNNSMIVMLQLSKGLIQPARVVSGSFAEVKNRALEGSDYDNGSNATDEDSSLYVILVILGIAALIAIPVLISAIRRKKAIQKMYREADYFRDVPNGGNTELSYYLARDFDMAEDESAIIGTCLMQMINHGNIEPRKAETAGFLGKTKTSVELQLIKAPENALFGRLYNILLQAAGKDLTLQEKELEKYSEKHPEQLRSFMKSAHETGKNAFISLGGFHGGAGKRIENLSETGRKELSEIMGLKKFLLDFSLISEREIAEVVIWKDYLVYATLFGIADKVMEQLKKIYPERLPEFVQYDMTLYTVYACHHVMYRSMIRAEQAKRSSGGGGASSFGGGGGFSGGGFGGGSR